MVFFSLLLHFGAFHIIVNSFFNAYSALQQGTDHKLRKIWCQIVTLKTNVLGNDVIYFFSGSSTEEMRVLHLQDESEEWNNFMTPQSKGSHFSLWLFLLTGQNLPLATGNRKKNVTEITNRLSSQAYFQDVQLCMRTAEYPIEFQHLDVAMMSGCTISPLVYITAVEVTIRA